MRFNCIRKNALCRTELTRVRQVRLSLALLALHSLSGTQRRDIRVVARSPAIRPLLRPADRGNSVADVNVSANPRLNHNVPLTRRAMLVGAGNEGLMILVRRLAVRGNLGTNYE